MSAIMSALSTVAYGATYQPYQLQTPTQMPSAISSAKSLTRNPVPTVQAAVRSSNNSNNNPRERGIILKKRLCSAQQETSSDTIFEETSDADAANGFYAA